MKKSAIIFFIITLVIWPNLTIAIEFTPKEIQSVVQITSNLPIEAVNREARAWAGILTDEEIVEYRKELKEQVQLGSGVMVTYSGCALTNKHVIFDLESEVSHSNIHLWSSNKLTNELEDLGEATIVLRMTLLDVALVCLKEPQGKFFNHFILNPDDYKDFKLTLGEEIYNLGFPVGGERESLTLTSGLVAGVWDEDYLKGDITITGGVSGSPIFNQQKQIISLATGNAGEFGSYGLLLNPSYVYGWHDLYKQVYREVITDSVGCMNTEQFGLYQKQDQDYYDLSCSVKRNFGLEAKIAFEYNQYCGLEIEQDRLIEVADYIASGKSNINHWVDYLEKSCFVSESPVTVFEALAEE